MKKSAIILLLLSILMIFTISAYAEPITSGDFLYEILSDGSAEIIGYSGTASLLDVPETIDNINVSSIGDNAFYKNETIQTVFIPKGILSIGNYAFAESTSIRTIELPKGLLYLGDLAFQGCSALEKIVLPESLVRIGMNPFDRCPELESISIAENNPFFENKDGILFDRKTHVLISYPAGKKDTKYTIPEEVTEIGFAAFSECSYLEELTITEQVETINGNPFCGCTGLKKISVAPLNLYFETYSNALFHKQNRELIAYLWKNDNESYIIPLGTRSIAQEAFYKHPELHTLRIPDSVISIHNAAFAESGLREVSFPDSVITIGDSTFAGCAELTSVKLPSRLERVGAGVFYNCEALKEVTFPKSLISIGNSAFNGCTSLISIDLPDSLRIIGDYAFLGCTSLTEVSFPNRLYMIGRAAFYGIEGLKAKVTKGSLAEEWAIQNNVPYTLKDIHYMNDQAI